jgi:hypothetical protein
MDDEQRFSSLSLILRHRACGDISYHEVGDLTSEANASTTETTPQVETSSTPVLSDASNASLFWMEPSTSKSSTNKRASPD